MDTDDKKDGMPIIDTGPAPEGARNTLKRFQTRPQTRARMKVN